MSLNKRSAETRVRTSERVHAGSFPPDELSNLALVGVANARKGSSLHPSRYQTVYMAGLLFTRKEPSIEEEEEARANAFPDAAFRFGFQTTWKGSRTSNVFRQPHHHPLASFSSHSLLRNANTASFPRYFEPEWIINRPHRLRFVRFSVRYLSDEETWKLINFFVGSPSRGRFPKLIMRMRRMKAWVDGWFDRRKVCCHIDTRESNIHMHV